MFAAGSWDALAEHVLCSQHSSDLEAEDARCASDLLSEEEDQDSSSSHAQTKQAWWATLLEQHTKDQGFSIPKRQDPVALFSACTASFAEASVFKELGIPIRCLGTSEPCEAFREFAQSNHDADHWHLTMQDQIEDKPCTIHKDATSCCVVVQPDYLVMGTPCNPFSRQRNKRFHEKSVMQHELAQHTFTDAYLLLEKYEPPSATMEQSDGFSAPLHAGSDDSPLKRFLAGLDSRKFKHGHYVVVHKLDMKIWVKILRNRIWVNFFRRDLYSKQDVVRFSTILQALVKQQTNTEPIEIDELLLDTNHTLWKTELMRLEANSKRCPSSSDDGSGKEWRTQIAEWRDKLSVSSSYAPWDDLNLRARGLHITPRVQ
ncbi:unnamed protein product [Polarella glacialis]|uniref:DNA (cytosine-5-)-methyltransferase n=1 Tax=Polarella glacialis TaxID=89957 RepID=A0A813IET5_POLGL|nr:unnamed protein product [Polarella glacialis]